MPGLSVKVSNKMVKQKPRYVAKKGSESRLLDKRRFN